MPIAKKIESFLEKASWIRKMFEEGAALRQMHGPDHVFDFTLGNPTVEPPEEVKNRLRQIAADGTPGMHRYMNNAGYPETRTAIASRLCQQTTAPVSAEQVMMTVGAGGALNVILKTILNPNEEVLILTPYFVEYTFYVDNHGGKTKEVPTLPGTFNLDLAAIEKAIDIKTRAIIINSPNNPTGVVYDRETLTALGQLIAKKEAELDRQIYVISDEPYARICYDETEVPCIFDCVKNSIIATSHSKDLALPGERIGYLAANPQMKGCTEFINGAIFCNRVLGYVNAPALQQRLVTTLQHTSVDVAAYQKKRDLLYDKLTSLGFEMVKPQGAFYLFPKAPIEDDIDFVQRAQQHRLLLVPGSGFGQPGFFRIAYCVDEEMIRRSFAQWEKLAREIGLN